MNIQIRPDDAQEEGSMTVQPLTDDDLREALFKAQTVEEAEAITRLRLAMNRELLAAAVKSFLDGTIVYMDLIRELEDDIKSIGTAPGLEVLLGKANDIHGDLVLGGIESADDGDGELDPVTGPPEDKPAPKWPEVQPITAQPQTVNSKDFASLKDEYLTFFCGMQIPDDKLPEVQWYAEQARRNRTRYETVGKRLAIPWWFIAGIHALESGFNTSRHLHNGDPLTGRTRRVPAGRPSVGDPPYTWTESAEDAMRLKRLENLSDWSLPRALFRWELYNGLGYRKKKIPTPYLWSFSTVHEKGKYVADGRFSATAVSKQCGAATLLRYLYDHGDVELDYDRSNKPSEDSGKEAPPEDFSDLGPFGQFWTERLSHIVHFKPHELLVKGASNARHKNNTDPPPEKWENGVALVELLESIRKMVGRPVRLNSVYRSPAYNAAIGGAKHSQHKEFRAADLTVDGMKPKDVAHIVHAMRNNGAFAGGVGTYRNFVHIDTRGHNATWRG